MDSVTDHKREDGRKYLLLAWGSLFASLLVPMNPVDPGANDQVQCRIFTCFSTWPVSVELLQGFGVPFGIRSWRATLVQRVAV
jgi:hypothetical protein